MSNIIIRAENLGKIYIIGHESKQNFPVLRDVLRNKAIQIAKKTSQIFRGGQLIAGNELEEFWALKNINFEIKQGERVGIIGRNGAGKSTLLKVLSRITEPTKGRIQITGRVASLLEVGTGFHPELSGKENIFLNGAILGMSRMEIKRKFDEIVEFSGVERFLDTPVKKYSSGMYVRLAFAVAAHLEPEILIVDEVLAVGDAEFQKKCLGKMQEVSGHGRTVLFVSHNIRAIQQLCNRIILLNAGEVVPTTNVEDAIAKYSSALTYTPIGPLKFPVKKETLIVNDFRISQQDSKIDEYNGETPININIDYDLTEDTRDFRIGIYIKSSSGDLVAKSFLADWQQEYANQKKGSYKLQSKIPAKFLPEGKYRIELKAGICGVVDYGIESTLSFELGIINPLNYNNAYPGERFEGAVLLNPDWNVAIL
jgi:lipopolysaccharide transport system ATP-binding protein